MKKSGFLRNHSSNNLIYCIVEHIRSHCVQQFSLESEDLLVAIKILNCLIIIKARTKVYQVVPSAYPYDNILPALGIFLKKFKMATVQNISTSS